MLLPIHWMKQYVDIDDDARSLADRITLTGSHVESINIMDRGIHGIVVGKIVKLEKHPDADRLFIMRIDTGDRERTVITAAKNVYEGAYVALAIEGASLADGTVIGKTDFKGVESEGMLCSYQELGFEDKVIPKIFHDGVLIFDEALPLGTEVTEVLKMAEPIIEFEITPNRSDCLSIIGMAREAAATYDSKIQLPDLYYEESDKNLKDYIKEIRLETKDCKRYIGRVLTDVEIKPSPLWMQIALMQAGMRPINNMVDITNYVMLEFGQPLHAFDADTIRGREIIVRNANPGETMKTLDGEDRTLDPEMIMICDAEGPVGIAGVMGGLETEITDQTKNILIEAATFDSASIRKTSKKLGLRSEASIRYEKGLCVEQAELASLRVLQLAEAIGAGKPAQGVIDVGTQVSDSVIVELRPERVPALLGAHISPEESAAFLERLEFKVEKGPRVFNVTVPPFRLDVTIEADLIEEVGRLYGFHNIIPQALKGQVTRGVKEPLRELSDRFKDLLYGLGFTETMTYSFISPSVYDRLELPHDDNKRDVVKIENPLGEDYSVMRTTLLGNMLDSISKNMAHKAETMRFYEIGNVFNPVKGQALPNEIRVLTACMVGCGDFYDIKSVLSNLMDAMGLKDRYNLKALTDHPTFHSGRSARILIDGAEFGVLGQISYKVQDNYDISKNVYAFEFPLNPLLDFVSETKTFEPFSRYPAVERDLALVCDRDLESADLEQTIREAGGPLVKSIQLFDIYRSAQLGENRKSYAYKIAFQSDERTLVDQEIQKAMESILKALKTVYGISVRS